MVGASEETGFHIKADSHGQIKRCTPAKSFAPVWVWSAKFEGVVIGDLVTQVRERRTMNLMPRSAYVPEKYELLVATTSCKEQGQRKNEIYDRHTQQHNNQERAQSIHD